MKLPWREPTPEEWETIQREAQAQGWDGVGDAVVLYGFPEYNFTAEDLARLSLLYSPPHEASESSPN